MYGIKAQQRGYLSIRLSAVEELCLSCARPAAASAPLSTERRKRHNAPRARKSCCHTSRRVAVAASNPSAVLSGTEDAIANAEFAEMLAWGGSAKGQHRSKPSQKLPTWQPLVYYHRCHLLFNVGFLVPPR